MDDLQDILKMKELRKLQLVFIRFFVYCSKDENIDYTQFDVKEMEQDAFVLAVLEKTLAKYWPQPKSEHFCRCCNYSEFASKSLLDRHLQSARHLVNTR